MYKAFDGWFLSTRSDDGILSKVVQTRPDVLDEGTGTPNIICAFREVMTLSLIEPNMVSISD